MAAGAMLTKIIDTHLHLIYRGRLRYPWLAGIAALNREIDETDKDWAAAHSAPLRARA